MKEQLIKLFKQNNGYLKSNLMYKKSMRYHLNKMLISGEVSKIQHGLYILNKDQKYNEKQLIATLIPQAVFCLFTAWSYYDLSTTISSQYHIALHRSTKISLPSYPPIKIYYWTDELYKIGIEQIKINGVEINFYNIERSVCNAVKFRNKIGEDVMKEVLQSYIKLPNKNLELLMNYAKKLRIEKIISPYLKILL